MPEPTSSAMPPQAQALGISPYTGLLYALIAGYAVWGEIPNAWAWGGIALLVGSGMVMLQRERVRQPEAA